MTDLRILTGILRWNKPTKTPTGNKIPFGYVAVMPVKYTAQIYQLEFEKKFHKNFWLRIFDLKKITFFHSFCSQIFFVIILRLSTRSISGAKSKTSTLSQYPQQTVLDFVSTNALGDCPALWISFPSGLRNFLRVVAIAEAF